MIFPKNFYLYHKFVPKSYVDRRQDYGTGKG